MRVCQEREKLQENAANCRHGLRPGGYAWLEPPGSFRILRRWSSSALNSKQPLPYCVVSQELLLRGCDKDSSFSKIVLWNS